MNAMCPISFKKVNENIVRITAAITAAAILLFLFSPLKWIILIVAADFCIRSFWEAKYSPFAAISKKIIELLKVKPVTVDAAPKIFAARIGFAFSCCLIAAWLLKLTAVALIIGLMFALCAFLEAAFRFCVACKIYPFICKK